MTTTRHHIAGPAETIHVNDNEMRRDTDGGDDDGFSLNGPGTQVFSARDLDRSAVEDVLSQAKGLAETDVPKRISRFRIVRRIGRGEFGLVYEAYDEQLDRRVAIKVARDELYSKPESLRRFTGEAVLASKLDHPGIVPIYDIGVEDGQLFIAMGLCESQTLEQWMKSSRPIINHGMAVRLTLQLLDAIDHGHQRGVIHRDIKPGNIGLTDPNGMESGSGLPTLRVLDFGLSCHPQTVGRDTDSDMILGTPLYMAPEQLMTSWVGPEADVYSAGTILYELLTGHTPFESKTVKKVLSRLRDDDPKSPDEYDRSLPPDLTAVVLKALEKKPRHRYRTAAEFRDDLRRWLKRKPTVARPDTLSTRWGRWLRRESRVYEAGTVLVVLHAMLPVWSFGSIIGSRAGSGALTDVNFWTMVFYLAAFTIPLHGLFVLTGWRMWARKPSMVLMYLSLVAAAYMLPWHFGRGVGVFDPPTEWYRENPIAAWQIFYGLGLSALVDVVLLLVAIYANRESRLDRLDRETGRSELASDHSSAGGVDSVSQRDSTHGNLSAASLSVSANDIEVGHSGVDL